MTSLCHFGEASVIVSLLASTLTTDDALPVMYVRRYHHEGGCWRTRYRDGSHFGVEGRWRLRLAPGRSVRAASCGRYRAARAVAPLAASRLMRRASSKY